MKRALIDINVVLDVLLDRRPHSKASIIVWIAVETDKLEGLLAAHAVTTIHYLIRKEQGEARARAAIVAMLRVFGIAKVDGDVIRHALDLAWPDFEDSVSAAAAQAAGCDLIVTRDPKGFPDSFVRTVTPETAAALFANT
jgi:predicted nucleic acid-binding protein